ncbi:rho GDP-dissociation inhibitor 1 [Quercus suber]|uniref:Rho gdp-dissociation inhibitor 1 n=1 Tax=Quercus suber TaxID=58331 RepID=A0AAW0KCM7_QUESU
MQSLTILCPGRPDLILPIPFGNNSKRILFTLKEGSQYRLKFSFTVSNNIVLGLKYTNVVWKTGMKVDNSKRMLGTFSPQQEPYTCEMEEETTLLACLQEALILQEPSLLMMMENAIWTCVTTSKFKRIGQNPLKVLSDILLALAW